MKKNITAYVLIAALSLTATACTGKKTQEPAKATVETTAETQVETVTETQIETTAEPDFVSGDYEESGEGTMYLTTAGGTSEEGNVPVVYLDKDTILCSIGLDAWGMDGTLLSYIYVDGMLNTKEQLADTQITFSLTEDALAEGVHKVEVVQYENNDASGAVVTYKTGSYEIVFK